MPVHFVPSVRHSCPLPPPSPARERVALVGRSMAAAALMPSTFDKAEFHPILFKCFRGICSPASGLALFHGHLTSVGFVKAEQKIYLILMVFIVSGTLRASGAKKEKNHCERSKVQTCNA